MREISQKFPTGTHIRRCILGLAVILALFVLVTGAVNAQETGYVCPYDNNLGWCDCPSGWVGMTNCDVDSAIKGYQKATKELKSETSEWSSLGKGIGVTAGALVLALILVGLRRALLMLPGLKEIFFFDAFKAAARSPTKGLQALAYGLVILAGILNYLGIAYLIIMVYLAVLD